MATSDSGRKDQDDLDEIVRTTAMRKHRAAQARAQSPPTGTEEPKAVYQAACEQIAVAFAADDFRFAKSGPRITRTRGEWKESVTFQSDRNNVPGERVGLWTHANLESSKLKSWREHATSVFRRDAWVAGGQIGNLHPQHRWIDWELAQPENRERVVADVIREIRNTALPYFARVEDVQALHRRSLLEDVPSLSLDCAVDLFLCYLGKDEARSFLGAWRSRRGDLEPAIRASLSQVSSSAGTGEMQLCANRPHAEMYAAAILRYGLG